ncbi:transposase [Streptomyces sp. NBC_00487]|uniref:transposase n=1 Tax=unclassified Streptomyces TaxID=2593676 RepID=UPI002E19B742|nr:MULTISPECIES: transposase [unclassified Streptomyces]
MRRGDLTNDQWARLEPLLPQFTKPGRPPMWGRRQLIDGRRWRTRTGASRIQRRFLHPTKIDECAVAPNHLMSQAS